MTTNPEPSTSGMQTGNGLSNAESAWLTDLLELNLDSHNGYTTAANALHNPDYAALFRQYAQERQANADGMGHLLAAHGRTPTRSGGTLSGLLHQGWLNLESLLTTGDASIFAECERVDSLTLAAYQDVMGKITREDLMEILRQQFTVIRNAYERVKSLRSALEQTER